MIPLATTTVRVDWTSAAGDPYEAGTVTQGQTNVRAHISAPSGREQLDGSKEIVDAVLLADAVDLDVPLSNLAQIVDESTGERWSVSWVRRRRGLGLDHVVAGLNAVRGDTSE